MVEAGPYMFITRDLILAHARPENGVKHLDLSIGIATDGIEFEGGKTARVIFCLVVEDQQKHGDSSGIFVKTLRNRGRLMSWSEQRALMRCVIFFAPD